MHNIIIFDNIVKLAIANLMTIQTNIHKPQTKINF